jgi:uncharacterized repeat protein (TIGR01451 family)
MTIARQLKQASLALLASSSLAMLQSAHAAGTAAGTPISNTATVTYSVGTVAQAPITSNVAQFVVDSRIDLTVTRDDTAPVIARPNEPAVLATFTVANTGNSTQSYQLTPTNITTAVFGNVDTVVDDLVLTTAWDSNGNGAYDAGADAAGHVGDIAPTAGALGSPGTIVRVFVLANVPATAQNGQFASIRLAVRAATAGSTGATLATADTGPDLAMGAPQVVFADAGRDNLETVDSQYAIQSAAITLTKAATVVDDGFGTAAPNAKAIPGATVEYTITVANSGASPALNLTVTDTLPAQTAYLANTLQLNGSTAGSVSGSSISVPISSVAVGATATIRFRVTIQ